MVTFDANIESGLWDDYRANPSTGNRNKLADYYLPFARHIANKTSLSAQPVADAEDYRQDAYLGLLDAIGKYDCKQTAVKFRNYAYPRIAGAIFDAQRQREWVPRLALRRRFVLGRAMDCLMAEGDSCPDSEALCGYLGVDEEKLERIIDDSRIPGFVSIDTKMEHAQDWYNSNGLHNNDCLASNEPSPDDAITRDDTAARAVKHLPDRKSRLAFQLYFFQGFTMKETGKVIGFSECRVSQILSSNGRVLKADPVMGPSLEAVLSP